MSPRDASTNTPSSSRPSPPPPPPQRTLRLLVDAGGPLRRLSVSAGSVEELQEAVRAAVAPAASAASSSIDLELYDPLQERFGPLPSDLAALSSVARLRIVSTSTDSCSNTANEQLALPWRRFPLDLEGEGFPVGDRRLVVRGVENSGQGTGHTTWDGAVVLAKYIEHAYGDRIKGKRVLETGAGTGLVGLACAALGAGEALLTDLPYALRNLEANVARNEAALARTGCRVRVQEGDWFKPPSLPPDPSDNAAAADLGPVDVIVAADVVWLDELVPPFAAYLRAVLHRPGSRHAEVLMSYQTRSRRTDALLLDALRGHGLDVQEVDPREHHPHFQAPDLIHVFRIRLEEWAASARERPTGPSAPAADERARPEGPTTCA